MLIKNGEVLLFELNGFVKSDIRIQEGKIKQVASGLVPEGGEEILNASGQYITPGLIDAHSHICISEEGRGEIGDDCNDYSSPLMPYLDAIDAVYPEDMAVKRAVEHGVTSALICPGSDSVIGGTCSLISLHGIVADEMEVVHKAAMKCAFGENPKRAGFSFKSRMGNAYLLRKCFEDALDYRYQKETANKEGRHFKKDLGMENMLLLLDRKIPLHAHAHRSDDICTAIRIAREYNIKLVIIHATDGSVVADHIAKSSCPVIMGPTLYPRSKLETLSRNFNTAALLVKAGVKVFFTADHDVTPIYYLSTYAAESVRAGLDELTALKAITASPADILGVGDRKGYIRVGYDADLVLWTGHPFHYATIVAQTFISGKRVS